ncbi:MAG: ester cyclase [Acidobacteriota bacterium]|nr:ester cyclase [Acidobacteriota bacterium]
MNSHRNIDVQRRILDAVNTGKLEALRDLIDGNVVDHDPAPGQGPGPLGFMETFAELRAAFPNLHIEVKHTVADEHCVAIAYKLTGTHRGRFMDIAPTGHTIIVRGVQMARFYGGHMVERWGALDELGILEQLGVAPGRNRMMA